MCSKCSILVVWFLSFFAVSDHTTVETVFERYLKDKELETTNIYTIRNRYNNHIKPIIGKIPVMLLTKQDLKRVIYTAYRKCDLSQKASKIYVVICPVFATIWIYQIFGTTFAQTI